MVAWNVLITSMIVGGSAWRCACITLDFNHCLQPPPDKMVAAVVVIVVVL